MYHNTTHSTGTEVKGYRKKAQTQEQRILTYFTENADFSMTASEVMNGLSRTGEISCKVPLTSIRRGITNLTGLGKIQKTNKQVKGPYGRPEYCYRLSRGQQDMFQ